MTKITDIDEDGRRRLFIGGRDVTQIPCFRDSLITGITSGLVGGILYFLFTSKTKNVGHAGMATYVTVTLGYWFHCRHQWVISKFNVGQMQDAINSKAFYEGTLTQLKVEGDEMER